MFGPRCRGVGHSELTNSKYGLRGVREGEASNPGPAREQSPEEIFLSELEAALTRLDSSDEELLVRPVSGKNVVRGGFRMQFKPQGWWFWPLSSRNPTISAESCEQQVLHSGNQRWSPLNVPVMWAAARVQDSNPVGEWLVTACGDIQEPVEFHGGIISASGRPHMVASVAQRLQGVGNHERRKI